MIRPQPQPGRALPRLVAIVLTAAVLVGAQTGLRDLAVPAFASGRSVIRELDPLMLERFAVPPAPAPDADAEEEEAPEPEEVRSVSLDEEVVAAVEQLEELFGADEAPAAARAGGAEGDPQAGGIAADVSDERFESLFGVDVGVVAGRATPGRTGGRGASGAGGLGIGIEERPVEDDPATSTNAGLPGPDVAVRTGGQRQESAGEELDIEAQDPEAFDESAATRLGAWMRAHAAPLPVGVRVHMNYEPSFLTSVAEFENEGHTYELYLMFNESLREVHVVLVDGDRSVYLIDRGFQEQSRSLREGAVRRSGGQIVAIDSRSGAASGERSTEFYDVFLSWWTSVDPGAGTGR
jgi:hypothetical protein